MAGGVWGGEHECEWEERRSFKLAGDRWTFESCCGLKSAVRKAAHASIERTHEYAAPMELEISICAVSTNMSPLTGLFVGALNLLRDQDGAEKSLSVISWSTVHKLKWHHICRLSHPVD